MLTASFVEDKYATRCQLLNGDTKVPVSIKTFGPYKIIENLLLALFLSENSLIWLKISY